MFKILTVIFSVSALRARIFKPGKFNREIRPNQFTHQHLTNMTGVLCKDVLYKMRMAELIQQTYRTDQGYELGLITARIMSKFRQMIRIYRYYSNPNKFKNHEHTPPQIINAYAIMQGYYTELRAETVLFYEVLSFYTKKDETDSEKIKHLAKKYKMSVSGLMDLQKKGVVLSDLGIVRRSMQPGSTLPEYGGRLPKKDDSPPRFLLENPMSKNINTWTPKKNNNTEEEKYKKKLRYAKWAEQWKGFDGEIEGVNIADTIARLGSANDSDFLLKELKGDF